MSRASWSKAGSGVNWSSPVSSAGTGAGPRGSGPRRRGAACCWTVPGRGSRTARRRGCLRGRTCCCLSAARSAGAEWRHSCCWRTGCPARPRPRCPAGAGRACSRGPIPCRAPVRRLRRPQCPRPAPPLPPRRLPPRQPTFQLLKPSRPRAKIG